MYLSFASRILLVPKVRGQIGGLSVHGRGTINLVIEHVTGGNWLCSNASNTGTVQRSLQNGWSSTSDLLDLFFKSPCEQGGGLIAEHGAQSEEGQ